LGCELPCLIALKLVLFRHGCSVNTFTNKIKCFYIFRKIFIALEGLRYNEADAKLTIIDVGQEVRIYERWHKSCWERERERERERDESVVTYSYHSHHSARVSIAHKGAVAVADYSGPLCRSAFAVLRPRVVLATTGAKCLVLRMDKCLCLLGEVPEVKGYTAKSLPGAVLVRPDQYQIWADYALAMANIGIKRVVFRLSEKEMCRELVDVWIAQ
jgi:hypothetical protein